jgi:hypothetical protein
MDNRKHKQAFEVNHRQRTPFPTALEARLKYPISMAATFKAIPTKSAPAQLRPDNFTLDSCATPDFNPASIQLWKSNGEMTP